MTSDWGSRVGDEAAGLIRRAAIWRRTGGTSLLFFVLLEITFEVAHFWRLGIEWSSALFAVGMFGLFRSIALMAQARRVAGARLGLTRVQARWVRLRHGTAGYDAWLAARNHPNWPRQ